MAVPCAVRHGHGHALEASFESMEGLEQGLAKTPRHGHGCPNAPFPPPPFLAPLTPTYPQYLNWPVANTTAKVGGPPPLPFTQSFPNSSILSPSQPPLVLRDTLCSCEVYGMRPTDKGEKCAHRSSTLPTLAPQLLSALTSRVRRQSVDYQGRIQAAVQNTVEVWLGGRLQQGVTENVHVYVNESE